MIISEQWLRDWVKVDLAVQEIAECLTNAGLEVDGVETVSGPIDNLVVGRVESVSKHPDADRLNLTSVNIGSETLQIVCGASNVREGLVVAVATVGAKLPNGLKIKKAKVRGIESNGMLCSAAELGLEESSAGLIELGDDAEIGQRVDEYLSLDDSLIDIDLTPNRGDCLSVQGVARELKVLADGGYHPLDIDVVAPETDDVIEIDLSEPARCPRYVGRIIKGIDPSASTPLWMQERLRRSGVRPISPVVDITNYVMLELGQPMHAFDLSKLDQKIVVRTANAGEKITLLDESEASLDEQTLVIADASRPIAIAGVMGGADSAIDDQTVDIVLEAAHFTRQSASGAARRFGLHTESSHRFERGVDPMLPRQAMERATELVIAVCGGSPGPVAEKKNEAGLAAKPAVVIRLERLISLLGMPLAEEEVHDILTRISSSVSGDAQGWSVSPPSYRFDIEREADLVEEVARVKGYDSIPTVMPRIAPRSSAASESSLSPRVIRQALIARDYREAITYSFIDSEEQALFSTEAPVALANPLADNMAVMRTSQIPGLLKALQFNANRQRDRIRLFEIGATYHRDGEQFREVQRVSGVVYGRRLPVQWSAENTQNIDFYDIKADLEAVLSLTGQRNPIIFDSFEHIALHPGQQAKLVRRVGDDSPMQANEMNNNSPVNNNGSNSSQGPLEIGWLGRLHPSLERRYGVNNVFAFELILDNALTAQLPVFSTVSKFPSIKRDLSIVVDESVPVALITGVVQSKLGDALVKVELFDVYRGDGVADDSKSVSLSLVLQHADKTMTDDEAEALMTEARATLEAEFGAKLRS